MIIAAADGSALGNPGPAGWAWYVDDACWAAGGWPHATNNQAELTAVLELFRATAHRDDELHVLCDSQYVINAVTKWMAGWKRKGWRKADGKPVMNVELLMQLDEVLRGRRYRFEWVKGHVGHALNEAADSRARAVAEAYRRGAPAPSGPGWTHDGATALAVPIDDHVELRLDVKVEPEPEPELDEGPEGAFDAASDDEALFVLGEPVEPWHALTLELSTEELDRLVQRARAEGVSPEEFLRGLI
ncbi:ribonuclease HI [Agromyces ramosus]|uniref:Ribonuclease H n=1 Tax=Agromyces ramosus TaxID=33879 RepID=A0A4Q7MGV6_9MICO|nr:RNase H family protein [Agromyces ramosus]RZS65659.1 ribonuclease HI [Agromyces ramosus]